jgi:hypothetical protein
MIEQEQSKGKENEGGEGGEQTKGRRFHSFFLFLFLFWFV